MALSPHFAARENVEDPSAVLIRLTSGAGAETLLADWPDRTLSEFALMPVDAVAPAEGLDHIDSAQLASITRCIVPYGGLLRGRLAPGQMLIVNGAKGSYGSAAVLLGIAMGAARVIAVGCVPVALEAVACAAGSRVSTTALTGDVQAETDALRAVGRTPRSTWWNRLAILTRHLRRFAPISARWVQAWHNSKGGVGRLPKFSDRMAVASTASLLD